MNRYGAFFVISLAYSGWQSVFAQSAIPLSTTPNLPATYAANYVASANGLKASASRSLRLIEDGVYELANELQATVLGQEIARLDQRSRFHIADSNIVTEFYSYRLSGISSDSHSIEFDWENGTALSIEEEKSWSLALREQVFDPLSHQFAMSQQLRRDHAEAFNTTYEFNVIDGDEIESHLYQLIGEELLQTPLGNLNTVKLERVRGTNSARSTVIWLAYDWDFLVARIEQTNGSLQMKLELETAELAGSAVVALP